MTRSAPTRLLCELQARSGRLRPPMVRASLDAQNSSAWPRELTDSELKQKC